MKPLIKKKIPQISCNIDFYCAIDLLCCLLAFYVGFTFTVLVSSGKLHLNDSEFTYGTGNEQSAY